MLVLRPSMEALKFRIRIFTVRACLEDKYRWFWTLILFRHLQQRPFCCKTPAHQTQNSWAVLIHFYRLHLAFLRSVKLRFGHPLVRHRFHYFWSVRIDKTVVTMIFPTKTRGFVYRETRRATGAPSSEHDERDRWRDLVSWWLASP